MTDQVSWIIVGAVALSSLAMTGVLGAWLKRAQILDRPNERSSHTMPTPRGGGIAIVITAAAGALTTADVTLWPVGAAALLLALVSWMDDYRGLSIILRLSAQALAVSICLMLGFATDNGATHWILAFTALAWLWFINLYNFMDGIDGITGVQTLTICVGIALVLNNDSTISVPLDLPLVIAAAVAGFLVWNWPPAKIFMGDVGSVTLGFVTGWMLLELALAGQWAAAVILPLYYLADATITLTKRALRGEKFWRPHREHFYQIAHQRGLSHQQISLRILGTNILLIILAVYASHGNLAPALGGAILVVGFLLFHLANSGEKAA